MLSRLFQLIYETFRMPKPPQEDDSEDWSLLSPPTNPLDIAGWDRYWIEHIRSGIGPPLLDMFHDDSTLVRVMHAEGMKRILCAGNGISQEPNALAAAGMEVIALDISPKAIEIAKIYPFESESISQYYDPELQRPDGKVEFITGDILDSTICPGPFDVIIERLTAQNYYTHDIGTFLNVLTERLSENGIFFSHCHDGACRPPAKPRHYAEEWFRKAGWTIWNGQPGAKPTGRVAWSFLSPD